MLVRHLLYLGAYYLHGDIEEASQQEFIVDGHGDEAALIEFGRRLPHHNTKAHTPGEK